MATVAGTMYSAYSSDLFGHFNGSTGVPSASSSTVSFFLATTPNFVEGNATYPHPIMPSQVGGLSAGACQVTAAVDYTYSAPTLKFSSILSNTTSGNMASFVNGSGFGLRWNLASSFTVYGVVAIASSSLTSYTLAPPTGAQPLTSWSGMVLAYWPLNGSSGITPIFDSNITTSSNGAYKYQTIVTFPTVEIAKLWTTTNNFKQTQATFQKTWDWDARKSGSTSTTSRFRFLLMRDDFVYDNLVTTLATSDVRIGGYHEIGFVPVQYASGYSGLGRRSFTDTTVTPTASNAYVCPGTYVSGYGHGSTTPASVTSTFVSVAASGTANALIFCYYDGGANYMPLQYIPLSSTVPLDGIDKTATFTSLFDLSPIT